MNYSVTKRHIFSLKIFFDLEKRVDKKRALVQFQVPVLKIICKDQSPSAGQQKITLRQAS